MTHPLNKSLSPVCFIVIFSCVSSFSFSQDANNGSGGIVTDIDGNVYKTVKIGNKVWMAENLRVSRYRNGDSIPNVTDNKSWRDIIAGSWCYYNNDPTVG